MILCTDPILKGILVKKQVNVALYDSVLTRDEKQKMLENLYRFATGWFLDERGRDFTEYRGVSIGGILAQEVMMLYSMLNHFIWIYNKVKKNEAIKLYESESCKVPMPVRELIAFTGGETITCDESYPYLCFNKLFKSEAGTQRNNSVVDLSMNRKDILSKNIISQLKVIVSTIASRFFHYISKKNQLIYINIIRALSPFYRLYVTNDKNDVGLMLDQTTNKYVKLGSANTNRVDNAKNLFIYNTKGIRTHSLGYPNLFSRFTISLNAHLHDDLVSSFKNKFHHSSSRLLRYPDSKATRYFTKYFQSFYLEVLPRFIQAIDYYYKKHGKKEVKGSLVEAIHPLNYSIFSNLKKHTICVPPNFFLHNQYLAPYLINRVGAYFRCIAVSAYDKTRYIRMGFKKEQVEVLDAGNLSNLKDQLKPYKTLKRLEGTNVLIIPPWIDLLHHFRHLISGENLIHYLSDIVKVLDSLKISSVNIRIHPDVRSIVINDTNHSASECYRYIYDLAKTHLNSNKIELELCDTSHSSLEDEIQNSDFVIGPISKCLFDALLNGRDYVVYDNSISPYPGEIECNLVDDGLIKCNKNKEDLKKHLNTYKPIDRDHIFQKYYSEIFFNKTEEESADKNLLDLLNLQNNKY